MDCFSNRKVFNTNNLIELQTNTSSKGNQKKWYDPINKIYVKERFLYQDVFWKDDLVEIIGSNIGNQLMLKNTIVINQELAEIVGEGYHRFGVCSRDFNKDGFRFISFAKLSNIVGEEFPEHISLEGMWEFILDFYERHTKLDLREYFIAMSIIDFIVGNEDRHFGNFGCLTNDKEYKVAPLFDFGLGLFEHDRRYLDIPFIIAKRKMSFLPFTVDEKKVIEYLSKRYNVEDFLPKFFDCTDLVFPSANAIEYFKYASSYLGIELRNLNDKI
jgi:hypothetical protein